MLWTNSATQFLENSRTFIWFVGHQTIFRKLNTIYWFWCEELRDSVEADLKQCALLDNVWFEQFYIREKLSRLLQNNVILVRFESWLHFRRRLDNLPASGAGVDATDFFLSFKLACEAVGWLLRKIQQTGPTGFEFFQCISNISKCIIYHQHWTLAKVYRRSWSLLLRPVFNILRIGKWLNH